MTTFDTHTFSCFAESGTPPATVSPYMDLSPLHPAPALRALCLRWIAYLHGHVTAWGKGASLCASLTVVQLPPSRCHYFHSAAQERLETFHLVARHVHESEELVGSVQVRNTDQPYGVARFC